MKGGIEAGDVRDRRVSTPQPLDQLDFVGKMIRGEWNELFESDEHILGDANRIHVNRTAMHQAMADDVESSTFRLTLEPLPQCAGRLSGRSVDRSSIELLRCRLECERGCLDGGRPGIDGNGHRRT